METEYTYGVDDFGVMTIYDQQGRSIADISNCEKLNKNQLEALAVEILSDLEFIEDEEE